VLTIDKAVADARRGQASPVYLLHGDEYLTREGARALIDVLVPVANQSLSVEVLTEEAAQAALGAHLATLPLFGGTKVVVVHDIRAFVSKPATGGLARKSLEAWQAGDMARAARLLLQAIAASGEDAAFLARAARGEVSDSQCARLVGDDADPDASRWLQEVAARAAADRMAVRPVAGGAQVYEQVVAAGIPAGACLVLTAELVDERRTLFKRIREAGVVIDCGVRGKSAWDTQMRPEAARARIAEAAEQAGKVLEEAAVRRILEQTGFSVRTLESELEKLFLYVGERRDVTAADADAVLVNARETSIIALANALGDRDPGRALQALRSLTAQREPSLRILATLAGEIRSLILARSVLEERLDGMMDPSMGYPAFQARVLPRLKAAGPAEDAVAYLAGMHPFRAFNLLRAAVRFPLGELLRDLEAIHEADLSLKTSGQPEDLILEPLLLAICAET
jgi:DNA polymerase-3 subunit delta